MNVKPIIKKLDIIEAAAQLLIKDCHEARQLLEGDVDSSPARKGKEVISMEKRLQKKEQRRNNCKRTTN